MLIIPDPQNQLAPYPGFQTITHDREQVDIVGRDY
jgi:hypothetical protein